MLPRRRRVRQYSDAGAKCLETDMRDGVMTCLMFTDGDEGATEMLASVLEGSGLRVTRSGEPDECLDLLAARRWDCLVIAAVGDSCDSLSVLSQCRQVCPEVPALVLVRQDDTEMAVRAMKAGAADCLEMPATTARLLTAVTDLCRQTLQEPHDGQESLSPMERTVLGHILEGQTNRKIAEVLCRSPRTIEVHRHHIMKKLGVASVVDLVRQTMGG